MATVKCVGSPVAKTVSCGAVAPLVGGISPDLIVGQQGQYVKLTSTNVAYNSGTGRFTFDVTLQNLVPQKLGTTDGAALDPNGNRIFFESGPVSTSGSGSVSVVPDGFATFTASGQAYYQYDQILPQNQVSAAKTWTLIMPPSVATFAFTVYVSAPVQFPIGYVNIAPVAQPVHPDNTTPLSYQVITAVGNAVTGTTVAFSSADTSLARVTSAGVVTPLKFGTVAITGTDGTRSGVIHLSIGGTARTWNGATSANWFTGTNWPLNSIVPTSADTAIIQTGATNQPVLTAATIVDAVELQPSTSLDIGAFDLTVAKKVSTGTSAITGTTGRVVMTGGDIDGTVNNLTVKGQVTASSNVTSRGNIIVLSSLLYANGVTIKVTP